MGRGLKIEGHNRKLDAVFLQEKYGQNEINHERNALSLQAVLTENPFRAMIYSSTAAGPDDGLPGQIVRTGRLNESLHDRF